MLKILIANDGYHAHYFERMAWKSAFNDIPGVEVAMYDCKNSAAFDVFNTFEPHIFIGQLYNIDEATFKCIKKRPWLKVALRAGDWSNVISQDYYKDFNVLQTSESEIKLLEKLKQETGQPLFVFCHYLQDDMFATHNLFESKLGIKAVSILLSANVNHYYGGTYDESLSCDIAFVGGYWPYKGMIIDRMLTPLLFPVNKYKTKIFGNQPWPHVNQYCGHIDESRVKDLFASAKICPNLSEPHAHALGIEINERSFKVLLAGGFCIGDKIKSHETIFGDGMIYAETPKDFAEKVQFYVKNPEERISTIIKGRERVLKNHTNFHRAADFLRHFGYHDLSRTALEIIKDLK